MAFDWEECALSLLEMNLNGHSLNHNSLKELFKADPSILEDLDIKDGEEDVEDLFEVLAKRDVREPANWSRRFKNHQEKLKSGDVYQVAEVVRNLALRDQAKGLSAGEKSLYTKARNVLVSELAFALDVDEEAAMAKVDGALV